MRRTHWRSAFALGAIGASAAACAYDWEAFVVDDGGVIGNDDAALLAVPDASAVDGVSPSDSGVVAVDGDLVDATGIDGSILDGGDAALADGSSNDAGLDATVADAAVIDAGGIDASGVDASGVDATVVDAACTPSSGCLSSASLCAASCTQTLSTCQTNCGVNPPCRAKCAQTEKTCRTGCLDVCTACTTNAGCAAPTLCSDATK